MFASYLQRGGYIFSCNGLFVCLFVGSRITQKVVIEFNFREISGQETVDCCMILNADTLDLCTLSGEVIGLRKSPFEYVAAHVTDRETYVPVVVDAKRQKGRASRIL